MKTPIKNLSISVDEKLKSAIKSAEKDFKATLFIKDLVLKDNINGYEINNIELELEKEQDV